MAHGRCRVAHVARCPACFSRPRALSYPASLSAADLDWLAIVAGIVLAVGIVALNVMKHMLIEYDTYARLETLEGKK